jgi:ribose-phosphate pyrophosphokinase
MKDVILLADPKTPACGFAEKIRNYIKETKEKEISLYNLEMKVFGDKEIMPHILENIRKKDVYLIQSSNKLPNDWLAELIFIKDACLNADVNSLSFVLPNMRYSRQDRKHESRVPISTRAVANVISPGLKRIITMDLHSAQIQNAYPANVPLDNLHSFPDLVKYLKEKHPLDLENLAISSTDVGGGSRADSLSKRLNRSEINPDPLYKKYSFAIISKIRDKTGKIESTTLVGDVKDKNVLVIDDILDSGGSGICAWDLLREKGANKLLYYCTHGLFTEGTEKVLKKFDHVITSNTHYVPKNGDGNIEIINMAPTFAEAIYRAQIGLSISELFD